MDAIAYIRTATKEQSSTEMKMELERYAAANGINITEFFIEEGFGANSHRIQFEKVCQELQKVSKVLLTNSPDRLYRDALKLTEFFANVQTWGSRVICIKGGIDTNDKMMGAMFKSFHLLETSLKNSPK